MKRARPSPPIATARSIVIPAGGVELPGDLVMPPAAVGLVLFAHGSGSSRSSPRNRLVAERLQSRRIATLLFDLLTESESADRANVFDITLLATRLAAATRWAGGERNLSELPLGYFGASTGAAAALIAAAMTGERVSAIVSRGGRPDLASEYLPRVRAPTLLIVGNNDVDVIPLNRRALEQLAGPKKLVLVQGASHLFEEPGTLETAADVAANWFSTYLSPTLAGRGGP